MAGDALTVLGVVLMGLVPLGLFITVFIIQLMDFNWTGSEDFPEDFDGGQKHSKLVPNVANIVWYTPSLFGFSVVLMGVGLCLHPKIWGERSMLGLANLCSDLAWAGMILYTLWVLIAVTYTLFLVNFDPEFCGDITSSNFYVIWFVSQAILVWYYIMRYIWIYLHRDMTTGIVQQFGDFLSGKTLDPTGMKNLALFLTILVVQLSIVFFYEDANARYLTTGRYSCGRPTTLRLQEGHDLAAAYSDYSTVRIKNERYQDIGGNLNHDTKLSKTAVWEWWGVFSFPINTLLLIVAAAEFILYFRNEDSYYKSFRKAYRRLPREEMQMDPMEMTSLTNSFGSLRKVQTAKRGRSGSEAPTVGYCSGSK